MEEEEERRREGKEFDGEYVSGMMEKMEDDRIGTGKGSRRGNGGCRRKEKEREKEKEGGGTPVHPASGCALASPTWTRVSSKLTTAISLPYASNSPSDTYNIFTPIPRMIKAILWYCP